jgi:hypothetical protein
MSTCVALPDRVRVRSPPAQQRFTNTPAAHGDHARVLWSNGKHLPSESKGVMLHVCRCIPTSCWFLLRQ